MGLNLQPPRSTGIRNLLAIYAATFFASLGFSFATPLLPLFMLELLDGDIAAVGAWVGVSLGVAPLLTALTGPTWGALGDRYGQKVMMQRALVAIGLSIGCMALASQPWHILGLRGVIGALGGISVACLAATTAASGRANLGRNIGLLQASQTLGNVAGPLAGGSLALLTGMRPTFVIAGSLFALGLGLVAWLYRNPPKRQPIETRVAASREPASRLAGSPLFWSTMTVLFAASFLDGSFMVTLPLYLPALGAPSDSLTLVAGVGLSGGALAMAVSAAFAGRLSARIAHGTLLRIMLGLSVLALTGTVLATTWWQFIAMRVLLGFLAGGLPTVGYAAVAGLVPPARSGSAVGIASSATMIGWAVAPLVVGFLVGIDPRAVFAVDLILVAGCLVALTTAGEATNWRSVPILVRARQLLPSR